MKSALKFTLSVAAIVAFSVSPSQAALHLWNDGDSSWFTAGNWNPASVPTAGDNTQVNNGGIARVNGIGNAASTANLTLGNALGDDGTVRVNNNNTLTVNGVLRVGDAGTGTMFINDTAIVFAQSLRVGDLATGSGVINIGSPGVGGSFGLQLTINNGIIGNFGTGLVNIHDGGKLGSGSGNIVIGNNVGSVGSIIVRGENAAGTTASTLGVTGNTTVGDLGTGTLELHDGALFQFSGGNLRIARQAGSVGTVLVEGVGATSGNSSTINDNSNDTIFVGGDAAGPGGLGTLTIKNDGVVNAFNVVVWGNNGSGSRSELGVDSTYALNVGGTLTFNGGRLNFLGDGVDFINNVNLNNAPGPDQNGMFANVGDDNTATLSGVLTGNGQLVKTGTGTLILTNLANNYTGGTNINNGTVVVGTGSTGLNSVFGNNGVNLNGDINTRLRTPEGVPTFYLIGNFFNANTGQLYTQVGGTISGVQSDEMGVFGVANLDPANSHLFVHRINNYNPNNGDTVTIIATLGGVNGQFSDAPQFGTGGPAPNDFLGLIQPFADYGNIDPNSVDLVFGFAASFTSVAKTPNQIATAEALDAALAAGCIIPATNVLGNVPINTLRHAYDLIAPEELASMYEASFAQGMVTSLNLQHRMDDIRWGSTGFCADGFVIQDNHGYTKNDGKSVADKNPAVEETAPPSTRWGAFITGSGELTKTGEESENDPGAHGYQLNQAGFTMGVDYRVTDHWAIGLSGGYTHTHGDLVDDGRLNTDGGRMGLYTTWYTGGFYVDASASGGWNQYDTRRTAFLGQENGSTDGAEFNGMVAAGYDWKKGCWTFGPVASFEYDYVEFNSFTEADTSLIPLHYPDQNQSAYRSNVGFRVAHEQVMKPGEGLTVVPELRASWRHDFGPEAYAIDSNFVGCDDTFTVHGPWIGRDSAVVDLGLTAYCTPGLSAYIFYDGQFGRDNYNNNGISGGFRVAF